jgi:hypothetical protein
MYKRDWLSRHFAADLRKSCGAQIIGPVSRVN